MRKISILWRDLRIVAKAVWLNLFLFAGLQAGAIALLHLSGAYPRASWLDLIVNAFHMSVIERVFQPGDGIYPAVLTFLLPLLTVFILGEGALRVLTIFSARHEHREEWDTMVAKTYTNHIVVCGVGELGKALVKYIQADNPKTRIVLVDHHPGLLSEAGFSGGNVLFLQSDMTSIETLKKANCHTARLVLLASGNDAFNLEAAYKIMQLNPQTETWVRLHHSGLADLMDLSRKPNLHFFCPYEQAAEAIAGRLLHGEKINK
jgi:FlaA1/EpsC-like NDP-sugar epimerase